MEWFILRTRSKHIQTEMEQVTFLCEWVIESRLPLCLLLAKGETEVTLFGDIGDVQGKSVDDNILYLKCKLIDFYWSYCIQCPLTFFFEYNRTLVLKILCVNVSFNTKIRSRVHIECVFALLFVFLHKHNYASSFIFCLHLWEVLRLFSLHTESPCMSRYYERQFLTFFSE